MIPAVLNALVAAKAARAWIRVLLERLKSDDFVVRATAATGLAEIKAAEAVQPLTEAYRASAGGDVTYVARAAMLGALAKLDAAAARPLLQEALTDRDWAVRVRARTLLGEQGVTGVEDAMRPRRGRRSPLTPRSGARSWPHPSHRAHSSTPTGGP